MGQMEVAMKTLLIAFVAALLLVGGIMNKACKTHHHTWCAPLFSALPTAKLSSSSINSPTLASLRFRERQLAAPESE
jgi:hypothetical protein